MIGGRNKQATQRRGGEKHERNLAIATSGG